MKTRKYMILVYVGFLALAICIFAAITMDIRRCVTESKAKSKLVENMDAEHLDNWWAHLHVSEKERIASKASGTSMFYPNCTFWWNKVDTEYKKAIYDHCTDRHGLLLDEWRDGKMMSY